ncbi:MAG: hypothetical protein FJX03_01915 [Alphaproteobacteria bacterium]|nr:hypothetical protein [Alphaproteobacteria bacterium]
MDAIERLSIERNQSIQHQVMFGEKIIGYLYLSNAGAMVALVGYIAQKQSLIFPSCWKLSALLFCVGLLCAISSLAFAYFYQMQNTKYINRLQREANYNDAYDRYHLTENDKKISREKRDLDSKYLKNEYDVITKNPPLEASQNLIAGYFASGFLSALFFLIGFIAIILVI